MTVGAALVKKCSNGLADETFCFWIACQTVYDGNTTGDALGDVETVIHKASLGAAHNAESFDAVIVGRGVGVDDILGIVDENEVAGSGKLPAHVVKRVEAVVVCYRVTE